MIGGKKEHILVEQQHLKEVFKTAHGVYARSFPSVWPIFALDRIYARGFSVEHCQAHRSLAIANLSDHAVLTADLVHL